LNFNFHDATFANLNNCPVSRNYSHVWVVNSLSIDCRAALFNHTLGLTAGFDKHAGNEQFGSSGGIGWYLNDFYIVRQLFLCENLLKLGGGKVGRRGVVKLLYNHLCQKHLCLLRMSLISVGKLGDLFRRKSRKQREVIGHHLIGNAHHLAEHILRLVGYTDVIALGLAHLLNAVKADEDRHRDNYLGLLAGGTLEVAPDKVVKSLVCAAKLHIASYHYRIIALHQRIQKFVHTDRVAFFVAKLKSIAFKPPRDGHRTGKFYYIGKVQIGEPLAVVADFETVLGSVQNLARLCEIGLGVLLYLAGVEYRPCGILAAGVAYAGGVVADDEDCLMTKVLKLPQFPQHDRMAQMNIRRGRIHSQFYPQLAFVLCGLGNSLCKLILAVNLYCAAFKKIHLFRNSIHRSEIIAHRAQISNSGVCWRFVLDCRQILHLYCAGIMIRPASKSKAPRNRTISLNDSEIKRLKEKLLRINKPADIELVRNKTICQDIFEVLDFLPDAFVDLVFVDPPYNLSKTFNLTCFKAMESDKYQLWLDSWLAKMVRILKPTASLYICGDWKSSGAIFNIIKKYFRIQNRITWEREKGRGAQSNWKNCSEDIWFATMSDKYTFNVDSVKMRRKVLAPYRDKMGNPKDWQTSENGKYRITYPSNIWTDITVPFWSMPENTDHPTQKPEKLIAKIILAGSNPGDIVFDPFGGSGTTAVVAKKLGRNYVGVEIDEFYACLGEKRLEMAESDKAIQGYAGSVFWERNTLNEQMR
jgi:site-specific DNA-methyltransferase (adenine-specific)